jgi:hypothetical protein
MVFKVKAKTELDIIVNFKVVTELIHFRTNEKAEMCFLPPFAAYIMTLLKNSESDTSLMKL